MRTDDRLYDAVSWVHLTTVGLHQEADKECTVVKLLICVINSDDRYPLLDALIERGHSATVFSTIGGFLREGNTTLLIATTDQQVHDVLRIIRTRCATRTKLVYPFPAAAGEEAYMAAPIEVEVGGAVVFVLDVDRFEKL
jgi:uncharacterized protein YaaQ